MRNRDSHTANTGSLAVPTDLIAIFGNLNIARVIDGNFNRLSGSVFRLVGTNGSIGILRNAVDLDLNPRGLPLCKRNLDDLLLDDEEDELPES